MSRELATVETSSLIGQLSAIEILARHRELCGYETLDELARVLTICGQRPAACHVALDGPDTVFITRFEPAVDFLVREVGFQVKKEVIGGGGESSGGCVNTSSGMSHASVTTSRRAAREITSLVMPRPSSWRPGMPEPVLTAESADWKLFQHKVHKGLELVDWARWANTSLLTLRLTDVVWFRPPPSAYGFEVRMTWANVIGREQGQLFSIGDTKYNGAQPSVLEVCDSKCDQPCAISIYVYRDRPILPRKLVGKAHLHYDNSGVVNTRLDVIDPSISTPLDVADTPTPTGPSGAAAAAARAEAHGGGRPAANVRGSIRVEAASIRHRYTLLQEELLIEMAEKREADRQRRVEAEERARVERREERRRQREEVERFKASTKAADGGGGGGDGPTTAPNAHPSSRGHSRATSDAAASSTGAVRSDVDVDDDDAASDKSSLAMTAVGIIDDHDQEAAPPQPSTGVPVSSDGVMEPPVVVADGAGADAAAMAPPRSPAQGTGTARLASHRGGGADAEPAGESVTFSAEELRRASGVEVHRGAAAGAAGDSSAAPSEDTSARRRRRRRHAASDSD